MISYVSDLEGQWQKLQSFATGNPFVSLVGNRLVLADATTFVFGGDAIDRGPDAMRIVKTLLDAKATYGDRVVLIAGNRDLNKLRLPRELGGFPLPNAPTGLARPELLKWILANTMGARKAFEFRAAELGPHTSDEAVVASYLDDLGPAGLLRRYLEAACLGVRIGATLFLHGGVTVENFGVTPGEQPTTDVDGWLAALARFYARELAASARGELFDEILAYQAPRPGTNQNQLSVVYSRPSDALANPLMLAPSLVEKLVVSGIRRVIVGHTPSGDSPAIVRDHAGFELVMADNSYGRIEVGSQLAITDDTVVFRGITQLDDGTQPPVATELAFGGDEAIGRRIVGTGQLVKSRLADGRYLLFKGLPGYQVEQTAISGADLARATLEIATPSRD